MFDGNGRKFVVVCFFCLCNLIVFVQVDWRWAGVDDDCCRDALFVCCCDAFDEVKIRHRDWFGLLKNDGFFLWLVCRVIGNGVCGGMSVSGVIVLVEMFASGSCWSEYCGGKCVGLKL